MRVFIFVGLLSISTALGADCFEFFHVKRPVTYGMVEHEYIAALGSKSSKAEVFGLLKGDEDLRVFLKTVNSSQQNSAKISFLGEACDENAQRAISTAREYSKYWEVVYQNTLIFYARMGITPLMGKPCRNVALGIGELLKKYLH